MSKLFIIILILVQWTLAACTSAIVSGNAALNGRPLLWKHRDSATVRNAVGWFQGDKYAFIGVINAHDREGSEIWMGLNTAGFAIMNTHSFNIPVDDIWKGKLDQEGFLMREALGICETVDDFEQYLDEKRGEWGITANFGVIDAQGGAAFFECGPDKFLKIDANDPAHAPLGFIVRCNFSASEDHTTGRGFLRYQRANDLFTQAYLQGNLTPQFILRQATRDLFNPALGKNLLSGSDEIVPFFDTIIREYSVSSMVVQGVTPEEDPAHSVAWVIAGFPLTIPAIPVWARDTDTLPSYAKVGEEQDNCLLNAVALSRKEEILPYVFQTDVPYLKLDRTQSYLEQILQEEKEIFDLHDARKDTLHELSDFQALYKTLEKIIDLSP